MNTHAHHTLFEDIQGIVAGTLVVAIGLSLLAGAGLLTGGIAGIAFLIHYATGLSYGLLFFVLSLPFVLLGILRRGWIFTLKTLAAVALLSLFMELRHWAISFASLDPVFASVAGGLLIGVGLLMLFRHNASLGGFNVLALYCQDRLGWRAGNVQLVFDALVLLASLLVVSPWLMAVSLLGAVVLNLSLTVNHKPGRYLGM